MRELMNDRIATGPFPPISPMVRDFCAQVCLFLTPVDERKVVHLGVNVSHIVDRERLTLR